MKCRSQYKDLILHLTRAQQVSVRIRKLFISHNGKKRMGKMYHPFIIQQEKGMDGVNLCCFLPLIKKDPAVNNLFVLPTEKFYSLLLIWKVAQVVLIFGMQTFKQMVQPATQLMPVK